MPEIRTVWNKRKIIRILGITAAVYAGMKYLLPLVIPFLIAGILVKMTRPLIEKIHRKLKIKREWLLAFFMIAFCNSICGIISFFNKISNFFLKIKRTTKNCP